LWNEVSDLTVKTTQHGFTLIEIIVTILLGSILAALMFQFMGTALTGSSGPVDIVRDGAATEQLMEEIVSEYVEKINTDPANALGTIVTNYGANSSVTLEYITFNAAGAEQFSPPLPLPGTPTDTLKVTVTSAGHSLTTLLTNSRVNSDDPVSKY